MIDEKYMNTIQKSNYSDNHIFIFYAINVVEVKNKY